MSNNTEFAQAYLTKLAGESADNTLIETFAKVLGRQIDNYDGEGDLPGSFGILSSVFGYVSTPEEDREEGDATANKDKVGEIRQQVEEDTGLKPEPGVDGGGDDNAPIEGLTDALTALRTANADVTDAVEALNEAAEDNAALDSVYTDETKVEDVRAEAQQHVDDAQGVLTAELEKTVGSEEGSTLGTATDKHLGSSQELTEANLKTAEAGIQGEIDDATAIFNEFGDKAGDSYENIDLDRDENGANELLDLSELAMEGEDLTVNLAELNDEHNKNGNNGGGSDTIVLPKLSEIDGKVTIENMNTGGAVGADSVVLGGLESESEFGITVNTAGEDNQGVFPYIDVNVGGDTNGVDFNNLINAHTFVAKLAEQGLIKVENTENSNADVTATVAYGIGGIEGGKFDDFVIAEVNGKAVEDGSEIGIAGDDSSLFTGVNREGEDEEEVVTVQTGDAAWTSLADALGADGFAAYLENSGNLIAEEDVSSDLEEVGLTLSDLQDAAQDAATELDNARGVDADKALLDDVADAINAHIGAGGENVKEGASKDDLLALRNYINGLDEEVQLDEDGKVDGTDVTIDSDDLLKALAGEDSATAKDGVVTVDKTEAPESGEGTWVKGDAVDDSDTNFTYTYEPSAEEQALIGAVESLEARAGEIVEADAAKDAFDKADTTEDSSTLSDQLTAIDEQLEAIEKAESDLSDAEQAQTDAEEVIGDLETAVAEKDTAEQWFEDNDVELPVNAEGDVSGTADNDIFLFDEDASADAAIANFGASGEDQLFFGEGFSLVELGDEESITDKNVGEVDQKEIFWDQNGANVDLFVENEAFAGSGSGEADITQLTLAGVDGADLQDNLDNGTLVVGTAADIA